MHLAVAAPPLLRGRRPARRLLRRRTISSRSRSTPRRGGSSSRSTAAGRRHHRQFPRLCRQEMARRPDLLPRHAVWRRRADPGRGRATARKQLPPIEIETTARPASGTRPGAIVMANAGPGHHAQRLLHPDHRRRRPSTPPPPRRASPPFGEVVEGMDVVKAIFAAPVSPTKGEGVDEGPDARAGGEDHQGRRASRTNKNAPAVRPGR